MPDPGWIEAAVVGAATGGGIIGSLAALMRSSERKKIVQNGSSMKVLSADIDRLGKDIGKLASTVDEFAKAIWDWRHADELREVRREEWNKNVTEILKELKEERIDTASVVKRIDDLVLIIQQAMRAVRRTGETPILKVPSAGR
jgi:gas vesicle protein